MNVWEHYIKKECETCREKVEKCPGHFGHINLNVKVIHPQFIKFLVNICRCICLKCSHLLIDQESIKLETAITQTHFIEHKDKLNYIEKQCKKIPLCPHCSSPHPQISMNEGNIYKSYEKQPGKTLFNIDELMERLKRVSNEDLQTMGFKISFRDTIKSGQRVKNTNI